MQVYVQIFALPGILPMQPPSGTTPGRHTHAWAKDGALRGGSDLRGLALDICWSPAIISGENRYHAVVVGYCVM